MMTTGYFCNCAVRISTAAVAGQPLHAATCPMSSPNERWLFDRIALLEAELVQARKELDEARDYDQGYAKGYRTGLTDGRRNADALEAALRAARGYLDQPYGADVSKARATIDAALPSRAQTDVRPLTQGGPQLTDTALAGEKSSGVSNTDKPFASLIAPAPVADEVLLLALDAISPASAKSVRAALAAAEARGEKRGMERAAKECVRLELEIKHTSHMDGVGMGDSHREGLCQELATRIFALAAQPETGK